MSLFAVDPVSSLVRAAASLKIAALEKRLASEGFCLPYWTPPDNGATLAEALMQRLPNLYRAAFGGIEELCVQIEWKLENGEIAKNVLTPRSATGPSFKNMMIGSGKVWGKPEAAVLKLLPAPEVTHAILLRFALPSRREAFRSSLHQLNIRFPLIADLKASEVSEWIGPENLGEAFLGLAHWGKADCLAPWLQMIRGLAESRQGVWQEFHDSDAAPHLLETVREAAVAEWRETRIAEGFEDQQKLLKILSR